MKIKKQKNNPTCGVNTIITIICVAFALSIQNVVLACPQAEVTDPVVNSLKSGVEWYFQPQWCDCTGPECMQECYDTYVSGTYRVEISVGDDWVYLETDACDTIDQAYNANSCIGG